jgi:hypothetical protein
MIFRRPGHWLCLCVCLYCLLNLLNLVRVHLFFKWHVGNLFFHGMSTLLLFLLLQKILLSIIIWFAYTAVIGPFLRDAWNWIVLVHLVMLLVTDKQVNSSSCYKRGKRYVLAMMCILFLDCTLTDCFENVLKYFTSFKMYLSKSKGTAFEKYSKKYK